MAAPSGRNLFEHLLPVGQDFTLGLGIALIAGGAAGDHTVTGIVKGAELLFVAHMSTTASIATIADLTAEFTVTADDTINNAGGTATTNDSLWVFYVNKSN